MDADRKRISLTVRPDRSRKDTRNFACRMDASVFDRMEEYVRMARQSKTAVVELALSEYLERHFDAMRRTMEPGAGRDG